MGCRARTMLFRTDSALRVLDERMTVSATPPRVLRNSVRFHSAQLRPKSRGLLESGKRTRLCLNTNEPTLTPWRPPAS